MGSLLVYSKNANPEMGAKARDLFLEQTLGEHTAAKIGRYEVLVAGSAVEPQPLIYLDKEEYLIAAAGTLFYRGKYGQNALPVLLSDLKSNALSSESLRGVFAFVYQSKEGIFVATDWLGLMNCYHNVDLSIWSTSYLSVAHACAETTINTQAVYEYVFQGTTYGADTPLLEVSRLRPGTLAKLDEPRLVERLCPLLGFEPEGRSISEHALVALTSLSSLFDTLVENFGDKIDSALSGGLDSRLILAMLLKRSVRPRLHVYGRETDPDVKVAGRICHDLSLPLTHIDKAQDGARPLTAESIEKNFLLLDGFPIDGVFDSGIDVDTRLGRVDGAHIALNGGGGEVFRNFFYLPDRPMSLRALIWTFYSRFDPRTCTDEFDATRYTQALIDKLALELHVGGSRLRRVDVERAYLVFRCRYWMSRTISANARFGPTLTPLVDLSAAQMSLTVPVRFKNLGKLESLMIRSAYPELAAFPTDQNVNYETGVTVSHHLGYLLTLMRPPFMRQFTYRIHQRVADIRGVSFDHSELLKFVASDFQTMRQYFIVERVVDREQFQRIATLEYLFNRLGAA